VSKPVSFEEFVREKRRRPEQICFRCGKHKEIYTHYNGEDDKPLCNACNMKLRRESPGAIQVKLLKLCATAIGSVDAMLALPVEEKQKRSLQDMQDELKLMIRVWLGDSQADEEASATTSTQEATDAPTDPTSEVFAEERKAAVTEPQPHFGETATRDGQAGRPEAAKARTKLKKPVYKEGIDFDPAFLTTTQADELFELMKSQPFADNRASYGPQVFPSPRKSNAWKDRYALATNPQPEPAAIQSLRLRLSERYGVPFNSVQCNWHGGNSQVKAHYDPYRVIAMVRLGAKRTFEVGEQRRNGGNNFKPYPMPHGSLITFLSGGLAHRMFSDPAAGDCVSLIFRLVTPPQTVASWHEKPTYSKTRAAHKKLYDTAVSEYRAALTFRMGPVSDDFSTARKAAVSETADNLFETPKSAPVSRKNRKALIAARVEARENEMTNPAVERVANLLAEQRTLTDGEIPQL
jgi:hypothetical protein